MQKITESTHLRLGPARWEHLKHILADALEETSPEERVAALKRSCADDTPLLHEAEKLLAGDTAVFEEFAALAETRLNENQQDRIGERIGAYAVIRELGRGGMGAVYLGERADGQFQKQVAIKILKRGTDTDEVLRRFRNERQILANLDHSNITRLLDAGVTGDGLPYFVMEFIEGTPITRFVQKKNLDLRGRLELFLKVCSAVDLAHRNHIIHRDIKPGNVLVKHGGEPKLLDFGIAKLLSSGDDGDITSAVERRLTPTYAAPEQAVGESATVATDIYSLGAMLYELLADKPPHPSSATKCSPDDASRSMCSLERLPSQSVTDAKTRHELQGQLDRIVERAMEKEPSKRYPSAAGLARDIEQYLNGKAASGTSGAQLDGSRRTAKGRRSWSVGAPVVGIILLAATLFLLREKIASLKNYIMTHRTAPVASAATPDDSIHSIAVLPFEPLGENANGELLGLGMADAVISRMSSLKQLLVMPTSAVLKYKGPASDPLAAGRALHVDAILTGTVQQSGDRLRVTVQLVRSGSGRTLWSEKFDQTFTDIFGIQDSISDKVARSLVQDLSEEQQKQLSKHYTNDTAAYDSYLMGLYFWNQRSKEGLEKAIEYFHRAVERYPSYALAYALMADCYYLQLFYGFSSAPDRIGNAKAAADRAQQLDDSVAEGHVAAAMVQLYQKGDQLVTESAHQGAMNSLRRALALNPNLAIAHQRYAWALSAFGHQDDAVREMKRAQELDPLSPVNNAALGRILVFSRRFREALEYCHKAAELDPNSAPIQENLAIAYALNGMYQQAIEHYQKEAELNPEKKGDALALVATVLASAGRKSEADLMMPEILQLADRGKADPYNITVLYGARGEEDAAFKWFEKVLQRPSEVRTNGNDSRNIRYCPMLDPLRSDNRFAELLRRNGKASLLDNH
jgi:serine/threonine protein kinase/tetratricopeptide (TPR) repeat protein